MNLRQLLESRLPHQFGACQDDNGPAMCPPCQTLNDFNNGLIRTSGFPFSIRSDQEIELRPGVIARWVDEVLVFLPTPDQGDW